MALTVEEMMEIEAELFRRRKAEQNKLVQEAFKPKVTAQPTQKFDESWIADPLPYMPAYKPRVSTETATPPPKVTTADQVFGRKADPRNPRDPQDDPYNPRYQHPSGGKSELKDSDGDNKPVQRPGINPLVPGITGPDGLPATPGPATPEKLPPSNPGGGQPPATTPPIGTPPPAGPPGGNLPPPPGTVPERTPPPGGGPATPPTTSPQDPAPAANPGIDPFTGRVTDVDAFLNFLSEDRGGRSRLFRESLGGSPGYVNAPSHVRSFMQSRFDPMEAAYVGGAIVDPASGGDFNAFMGGTGRAPSAEGWKGLFGDIWGKFGGVGSAEDVDALGGPDAAGYDALRNNALNIFGQAARANVNPALARSVDRVLGQRFADYGRATAGAPSNQFEFVRGQLPGWASILGV